MRETISLSRLKFITIIALAAFFMAPATTATATHWFKPKAKCPCEFLSAFWFAQKQVAKIGGSFDITECSDDGTDIVAEGTTGFPCRLEFEVEEDSPLECGYELECGAPEICGELDVEEGEFILAIDIDELTTEEFEACRRQVKFIAEWLFGVECVDD